MLPAQKWTSFQLISSKCLSLKTASGSNTRISVLCLMKFLSNTPGSCWCPESLMVTQFPYTSESLMKQKSKGKKEEIDDLRALKKNCCLHSCLVMAIIQSFGYTFFPFWNFILVDEIVRDSPADPIACCPVLITSLESPGWSLQAHSWDTGSLSSTPWKSWTPRSNALSPFPHYSSSYSLGVFRAFLKASWAYAL